MAKNHGGLIGQEFFDLRSRLGTALGSLSELASESGADPDYAVILENLIHSLKDPFVFVVVGEVNVGKSTLLNALFSADITKTGVVPTTDKIFFFKHGPAVRHVPITNTLEEVFVPVDFLKDFNIVDTPGTNSIESEHQEITERFVPMADLVIFVFSAMNPWGASAWQFLEKVHQHWMRHVVFVLQQCDLRTDEEIAAILDYMKQLCRQRFEHEFPIFPVSAKKAYLARSSGLDRDRLMEESGFQSLEAHISRSISGSAQRVSKLENATRIAKGILASIQSHRESRVAGREEKARVMMELDADLAAVEARTLSKLVSAIDATEGDFVREAEGVFAPLRAMLSPIIALTSVLHEERSAAGLEQALFERLRAPSQERWALSAVIIEDDVGAAAELVSERIAEGLKVQLREDLRPDDAFWEAQRQRFVAQIEEILRRAVHQLELDPFLQPVFARTRQLARGLMGSLFAGAAMAVTFAVLDRWLLAAVAGFLGVLGAVGMLVFIGRAASRTREDLKAKFAAARPTLRTSLGGLLRDEVRFLYDSFTRILQPTREKLAEQEKRQAAQQEQMVQLDKTFQELEAGLGAMVTQSGR